MKETEILAPSAHASHEHDAHTHEVIRHFPESTTIEAVSLAMKQLGDPSRLRIFWLLCHVETCVIEIAASVDMTSPAVSHHLKLLKSAGLIVSTRKGKERYYKAADTPLARKLHYTIEEIAEISCPE
ncbi:MAG: metalloregulator ArsR/SmtB family transcription factor [Eubacteriales bacterium]|nr:metalloregulator ArsR/SmtB family transcription factor [Eubacteriales bacterium]